MAFAEAWRRGWARRLKAVLPAVALALPPILAAPPGASAQSEFRAPPPCLFADWLSDGTRLCVRQDTYNRDICNAMERYALLNGLPPDYFARLIWRESLFRPDAVSPKGAEGIAQFMPGTARLRGLENSFHALQALDASAEYLAELRDRYGNLGLAAAAYNAGETGLENFLSNGRLPFETRAYVMAITANTAEQWKDAPPETLDLALEKDKPFQEACVALAESRRMREIIFPDEGVWAPWGVQLAAHFSKPAAHRLFMMALERLPAPINAEKPLIQRERHARFGARPRYTARIGRQSRAEADDLCNDIRRAGGACIVFKN
ncbi:lytic transglycosylase domain-containing protein [Mycoplana sp. MJR14]|uniref:lytic transglycosylase domain-containing protein n=1 Tax=Mycoplana sp. MJR14 TaxID=3032583 RepID=UPI0023D9B10C|nr:lytic transglycosylase domain-containing protein [Mycoplana sp. MJR14]MDF1634644.1 lytic transglycosylase domain-containing protein [Mycoplana sp. MJR14]